MNEIKYSITKSSASTPAISAEQFISEHFFLYLISGFMVGYDGNKEFKMKAGDFGIARRNQLVKYNKQPDNGKFEKIAIVFDQDFLMEFNENYQFSIKKTKSTDAIVELTQHKLIQNFLQSLMPYFNEKGVMEEEFLDLKRSELLLILLKQNPDLRNIFFDFSSPEKIDLEEFMNRNYKFNVSIERFAYLTGRSLSAFKRDFQKIFKDTPSHWLIKKRLQEAYFQIDKNHKKPIDIYLDLGFEDLSHFSFAFKKMFGHTPSELIGQRKKIKN